MIPDIDIFVRAAFHLLRMESKNFSWHSSMFGVSRDATLDYVNVKKNFTTPPISLDTTPIRPAGSIGYQEAMRVCISPMEMDGYDSPTIGV